MEPELIDCDKEQIQFIEKIQPFGALFALDESNTIIYAAATPEFNLEPSEVLGLPLESILRSDAKIVLTMLGDRVDPTRPVLLRSKTWQRWMTCVAHNQGDMKILELEFLPKKEVEIPSIQFLRERREPLYTYLAYIADNLREVTGYDRVMVYRFAPDWHGEVIAESISHGTYSFMGHHFPASDIPAPARELFLKNWVRGIYDVDAKPIAIEGISDKQLDLTRSILRHPSEIHLEYLRNMKVKASLTLSLIHDGRLWGLIACHHFEPKYLSSEERNICALISKLVSAKISSFVTAEAMAAIQRVSAFTNDLASNLSPGQLMDAVRGQKKNLLQFISCDGFCAISGNDLIREGETPSAAELETIMSYLNNTDLDLFYSENLQKAAPELKDIALSAAGMIAIKLDSTWLVWFRKEYQKSRLWAGNPNKSVYEDNGVLRVSPRLSFEAWKEEIKGSSKIWEPGDVSAAQMLRIEVLRTLDGTRRVTPNKLDEFQEILESFVLQASESNA